MTEIKSPPTILFSCPTNLYCLASTGCRSTRKMSHSFSILKAQPMPNPDFKKFLRQFASPRVIGSSLPFHELSSNMFKGSSAQCGVFWEPLWTAAQKSSGVVLVGVFLNVIGVPKHQWCMNIIVWDVWTGLQISLHMPLRTQICHIWKILPKQFQNFSLGKQSSSCEQSAKKSASYSVCPPPRPKKLL